MIDPLLLRIISLGFASLFLLAAAHKLGDRAHFRASFLAYEVVPPALSGLLVRLIPLLELAVGIGYFGYGLFGIGFMPIPLIGAALLTSYTTAIGINLLRGRNYIDCGCSFSRGDTAASVRGAQQISWGLMLRNALLIILALVGALPAGTRPLHLVDGLSLMMAMISLVLIYGAFNQLLVNRNAIDSWRHKHA